MHRAMSSTCLLSAAPQLQDALAAAQKEEQNAKEKLQQETQVIHPSFYVECFQVMQTVLCVVDRVISME